MELRLTVNEAADYLGRRKHWVYGSVHKITGRKDRKMWITVDTLFALLKYAFLSKSYERYPYQLLQLDDRVKAALSVVDSNKLQRIVASSTFERACVLLALKIRKPHMGMFNIISYTKHRLPGEQVSGAVIKESAFTILCDQVAAGFAPLGELMSRTEGCGLLGSISQHMQSQIDSALLLHIKEITKK